MWKGLVVNLCCKSFIKQCIKMLMLVLMALIIVYLVSTTTEVQHVIVALPHHIMMTFLAEFLRTLCVHDGTVNSAKNRTNLRNSVVTPVNSNDQLFGLKRDLIRLIGNLCYQHRDNQNKVCIHNI